MTTIRFFTDDQYKTFCSELAPTEKPVQNLRAALNRNNMAMKTSFKKQFTDDIQKFYENNPAPNVPASKTTIEKLPNLLEHNFIVGESHSEVNSKKFLIENMKALAEAGFKTLYFEHLYYDDQASLDKFFQTGIMDDDLRAKLKKQDEGHMKAFGADWEFYKAAIEKYNFTTVVEAAQAAGIRVVAIDIKAVYESQQTSTSTSAASAEEREKRYKYMNYTAYKIIQREQAKNTGGKWFSLMGNAHVNHRLGVPGVADLLGAHSVYIFDEKMKGNEKSSPEILYGSPSKPATITTKENNEVFNGDVIITSRPDLSVSLTQEMKETKKM